MRTILPIVFALLVQHKTAPQKDAPPKPQQIVFGEPDWVSITPVKPDEGIVEATTHRRPGNLYILRKNFIRELYKTAENAN